MLTLEKTLVRLLGVMFIVKDGKIQYMSALKVLIPVSRATLNILLELLAKKVYYPLCLCTLMIYFKDCNDGDVRLLGGGFENEGTVEVCNSNIWGLVSDLGWTDGDARVVCNQLGYSGGSMLIV